MNTFFHSLFFFIVALGVLITVHEYGHFAVARAMGVKVLRFSIGFGPGLLRWVRGETEYVLAAVPLGGYVRMLDEREGPVAEEDLERAFNRKGLGARSAVVVAGPLANLLFAIAALWVMFMVGITDLRPILGDVRPGSLAARSGLVTGMEIVAVDGVEQRTWSGVLEQLLKHLIHGTDVPLTLHTQGGAVVDRTLNLGGLSVDDTGKGQLLKLLGIEKPWPVLPPVVGKLLPGEPAERAGFREGDRILTADLTEIVDWHAFVNYVQGRPGKEIVVAVERGGKRLEIAVTPKPMADDPKSGRIGAGNLPPPEDKVERPPLAKESFGPVAAFGRALAKTWDVSTMSLSVLGKMLIGQVSVQNLSGPLSIAQYAGQYADIGLAAFLEFLAVISISLFILNLLPVPVLDGGHLLYYCIEMFQRRPLSERAQMLGQQVGVAMLLGLMGIALYNDIIRLL
jgi:regulator of sigma E protease